MGRKPCCSKDDDLNKGAWTPEEDRILIDYVTTHGEGRWRNISKKAGLKRCGKSCRLRWLNYLRPGIKRGNISPDEEELIIRLHKLLGNRWSLIAGRLPGRTDNEIKNYWNTILSKRARNEENLKADACPDKSKGRASPEAKLTKDSPGDISDTVQPSLCEMKPSMSLAAFWAAAFRSSEAAINPRPQVMPQQDEHHQNNSFDGNILLEADDFVRNPRMEDDPLMNFEFEDLFLSDLLNCDLTGSDYISSPSSSDHPQTAVEPKLEEQNLTTDFQWAHDIVEATDHIIKPELSFNFNSPKVEWP